MRKQRSSRHQREGRRPIGPNDRRAPGEDRAAEAITVAWTASVSAVLLADATTIAAHFYARSHAESTTAPAFEAIMLLSASVLGLASLALLPIVWRARRLKPPLGYAVFAALVAAAPIIVTIARLVRP